MLINLFILMGMITMAYFGAKVWMWTIAAALVLYQQSAPVWMLGTVVGLLAFFSIQPLRKYVFSKMVMAVLDKLGIMPVISETEKTAIEAGNVWVDAELFSGAPNFHKINEEKWERLGAEEKSFMENQVATVCKMVDDWETYEDRELPKEVWDYIKKERFLV